MPHPFSRPLAGALLLASLPAIANESQPLDAVVVTATRTAQTADDTLAAVTVITREEIERRQPRDLPQLLSGLPGVDFTVAGGAGKTASLYLRGTESGHVLLLVDGVRMGSATLGQVAWQFIPVDQIERIEVVRGPRSHLYGSDAIGGVVQIFTRRGSEGFRAEARAGAGSHDTRNLSAGISGGADGTRWSLAAAHERTEGFDALKGAEPDRDGYRNTSLSARISHRFSGGAEVEAHLLRAGGKNDYDGSWTNENDFVEQSLGGKFAFSPLDRWRVSLSAGQSRDESKEYLDGAFRDRYETRRTQLGWQNDLTLSERALLTLGLDFLRDAVEGSTDYAEDRRDDRAGFVEYQYLGEGYDFVLGLRHDRYDGFGGHTTGSLDAGLDLPWGLRATAGYGTAFRAPTFNDLYYPYSGNPDLDPEESATWELGLSHGSGAVAWSLRAYRTEVDNLIDWACAVNCDDTDWLNDIWQPSNLRRARIDGLEATARTRLGDWNAAAALTLLDAEDSDTGNELPRRAPRTLRLDLDRDLARWHLGGSFIAQSGRWDDRANTRRIAGYGRVDLHADYALARHWRLSGQVKNLFDQSYESAANYNTAGRELFLSVAYRTE